MPITRFIRHRLDPAKAALFEQYAERWAEIIPRCGGDLHGYFVPHEGDSEEAWGLVSLEGLAACEAYRDRLPQDPQARLNFEFAQRERFILGERRTFPRAVAATYRRGAAP